MDYILRATAADGMLRAFIATTKESVNEAHLIHKTSPVVSAALGRSLTAAALMGSMLKSENDLITIKIKGNGEGKGLLVTANNKVNIKGYPFFPIVNLPLNSKGKLDVRGCLGEGSLTVIKDLGLKTPYSAEVPLISGEIAEDLTYYFAKSEQIPSSVGLGVLVDTDYSIKQAGGFIIQAMPNIEEELISKLENKLAKVNSLTSLLEEGKTPKDILEILLGDFKVKILDKIPINFYCNCSKERVEKALISIGKEEIKDILEKDKKATLHCHFCNKDYEFNERNLKEILKNC